MSKLSRRHFLQRSTLAAASLSLPLPVRADKSRPQDSSIARPSGTRAVRIVDTNVDIHDWPFRKLKYGETSELVGKLSRHAVVEAWTGSFDSLFYKNIDGVNRRLYEECQSYDILVPFGTVNPKFPGWKEDLRRVDEKYGMPGIKLFPGYHGYTLSDDVFAELLRDAAQRDLLVQIAVDMEDERMMHPRVLVPVVDVDPLADVLRRVPNARVMLVNPFRHVRRDKLKRLIDETDVRFEISNLDTVAGIERALEGTHTYLKYPVPLQRLLFGSHFPFFTLENALMKLTESRLTLEQATAVMEQNAKALLRPA